MTPPVFKDRVTPPATGPTATVKQSVANNSATLKYLESSPIQVRGPSTGRLYVFSGAQPLQSVDWRDVEALLRTRFFQKAH